MGFVKVWSSQGLYSRLDLQLPWLVMGNRFNQQAFLSYFSPYFLLFGNELKLPTSIQRGVMVVINMDDLNVWIQACE